MTPGSRLGAGHLASLLSQGSYRALFVAAGVTRNLLHGSYILNPSIRPQSLGDIVLSGVDVCCDVQCALVEQVGFPAVLLVQGLCCAVQWPLFASLGQPYPLMRAVGKAVLNVVCGVGVEVAWRRVFLLRGAPVAGTAGGGSQRGGGCGGGVGAGRLSANNSGGNTISGSECAMDGTMTMAMNGDEANGPGSGEEAMQALLHQTPGLMDARSGGRQSRGTRRGLAGYSWLRFRSRPAASVNQREHGDCMS